MSSAPVLTWPAAASRRYLDRSRESMPIRHWSPPFPAGRHARRAFSRQRISSTSIGLMPVLHASTQRPQPTQSMLPCFSLEAIELVIHAMSHALAFARAEIMTACNGCELGDFVQQSHSRTRSAGLAVEGKFVDDVEAACMGHTGAQGAIQNNANPVRPKTDRSDTCP